MDCAVLSEVCAGKAERKKKKKNWSYMPVPQPLSRVEAASHGSRGEGGPQMMVSGEPSLDVTPLKDLTLAWWCVYEYMNILATSLFLIMLIMISPCLVASGGIVVSGPCLCALNL